MLHWREHAFFRRLRSEPWTVQAEHCLQFSQEGPAPAPKTPTRDLEHAGEGRHLLRVPVSQPLWTWDAHFG